ncbi:MAG: pirin family protein [Pyrinomonadaceae bacterium]
MEKRKLVKVVSPVRTSDGAGVTLQRAIGNFEVSELDPFLLLDHFGSSNPNEYIAGFPMHPHRGIETVTYMFAGSVKHRDSSGNEGVIGSGDIQWMTAGSGIMHEEMPQMREGKLEGFQLWVNLPSSKKMIDPRYQDFKHHEIPKVETPNGGLVKVIAGEYGGISGVVRNIEVQPTYMDVSLIQGESFEKRFLPKDTVFAYIYAGSGSFPYHDGLRVVESNKLAIFGEGELFDVTAGSDGMKFLLVSGKPLGEPIARYGPFVMNTQEEISEALRELQQGTFVKRKGEENGNG